MIAKMEKLTFLVYHKEYESFLEDIRQLGVVHVVEKQRGEPDAALQHSIDRRTACRNLLQAMFVLADNQPDKDVRTDKTVEQIVDSYEGQQNRIQALQQQLPALTKDIALLEPWGDFDLASVDKLEKAGWRCSFYDCQEKDFRSEWEDEVVVVNRENGHVYFVAVDHCTPDLGLEPLRLPQCGLSALKRKKAEVEEEIAAATAALKDFCRRYHAALAGSHEALQAEIDLMKVKLSGEEMAQGAVRLLEGWVPEENVAEVKDLLDRQGVYYEIRPAVREENAPIKLKNNGFVRMYEVLTKMYGMPDYAEFDPTPILAPFFSLFFAFCMGDSGYGLVLILLGFVLKKKLGKSMAGMMNLVITLGVFTTVVGAVLGTFFGVNLFELDLPEGIKQFMVAGKIEGTTYDKQMLLALLIGVVHICLAMTVKAIGETVRFGFKESLSAWGWLLLVVGFICTGGLTFFEVISAEVSQWAFIIIGGISAIGIYLLNNLRRNVFVNIGAGVWDTYNMATGLLGDTLSYIRLYALGLAGGMLGGVFNQLAFMVNDAAGPALGWFFCGLILVFGHTLNIAMSCLSAFVHPLRLTFVEYFKNSGYDGKGEAYKPFSTLKNK